MNKSIMHKDYRYKIATILVGLLVGSTSWADDVVNGSVLTPTAEPVVGAVISDGYSVVKTDASGAYTMPYNPAADFVFISVPSGYDIPTTESGSPLIYQQLTKEQGTHTHSFTLHKQDDGGAADLKHVLLVFGDPQALDDYNVWRFKNETAEDVRQLKASYPAGTKFYGLCVGDVVWDVYKYFPTQQSTFEYMGVPTFMAIGNHDHNCSLAKQTTTDIQDSVAALSFQAAYGPTYYSVNIGAIHYVVMDNVYYTGNKTDGKDYSCKITQRQMDWLSKDIAQLEEGTSVVLAMHIPGKDMGNTKATIQGLLRPLGSKCYLMTGHSHINAVTVHANNFIEHNVAASGGASWSSDLCCDGSPNGYKVFETTKKGIQQWYFKGTGVSRDERIRTYPTQSIDAGNGKQASVLANIWDYDEDCSVTIFENGVEHIMRQFTGKDPKTWDVMLEDGDTRPNYPGSQGGTIASKNPGTVATAHLFYYTPQDPYADMQVVFTDRFGNVSTKSVLRHMMVAALDWQDEQWVYRQDFNSLPHYPNYVSPQKVARGTYIAGHTPEGWYSATSQSVMPTDSTEAEWGTFNYIYLNNGSLADGFLYDYGAGNPATPTVHEAERALGSLNTNLHQRISHALLLENTTGQTITSLNVSYVGEVWRVGTYAKAKENLLFSYALLTERQAMHIRDREKYVGEIATTSVDALTFTTPSHITAKEDGLSRVAIDGNHAQNRQQVTGTIDVTIPPGQVIMLRWDDNKEDNGDDQGLAIDDVVITATVQSTGIAHPLMDENGLVKPRKLLMNGCLYILKDGRLYNLLAY